MQRNPRGDDDVKRVDRSVDRNAYRHVGKRQRVVTQAGAVQGLALASDQVSIKTEAGAASLEFAKAPTLVRTTTGVGAVELRVPGSTAYAVDVHTGAGASSVKVDQDPSSTHRIEVRTEVGAVKIEPLP